MCSDSFHILCSLISVMRHPAVFTSPAPSISHTLDPRYLSLGTGLTTQVPNPFRPYVSIGALANPTVSRRQLLLPFPQFLSVQEVNNPFGSSTYHSLQAKLVKRMSGGVSVLASYTWSKLISNVNAQNAPIGPTDNTNVQNFYDLRAERAVSELDQPQQPRRQRRIRSPFRTKQTLAARCRHFHECVHWRFGG